jgi:hypothetical protein
MTTIQETVRQVLIEAARRLEAAQFPDQARQFLTLADQTGEPCVVAVAGRVNAGKSSFINALLGEDLAKVGTLETTATINYFRYGVPNPQKPVRCCWQNDTWTEESREFLDSLQGNDEATLKKACGIKRLEYLLPNDFLRETTLVDTPGTGALVQEHQNRTAEYIGLVKELRERHSRETREISDKADAVIYLVGAAAGQSDKVFLEQFQGETTSGARALNAIGVMSKIDINDELIKRRMTLARQMAEQLREQLNTVIPVSAGLARALQMCTSKASQIFFETVKRFPREDLDFALSSYELFLMDEENVSKAERMALMETLDWTVFTTLARAAADSPTVEAMTATIEDLAGFKPLHDVLDRHFFKRGHVLRCFRILRDARKILSVIQYDKLPAGERKQRELKAKLEKFVAFAGRIGSERQTAGELADYLRGEMNRVAASPRPQLEDVDRRVSSVYNILEEYNLDFEILQMLEERHSHFDEYEELVTLFGRYGLEKESRVSKEMLADTDLLEKRQLYWHGIAMTAREPDRRAIADRADARYGLILGELIR